jgi:hypothetical protein
LFFIGLVTSSVIQETHDLGIQAMQEEERTQERLRALRIPSRHRTKSEEEDLKYFDILSGGCENIDSLIF